MKLCGRARALTAWCSPKGREGHGHGPVCLRVAATASVRTLAIKPLAWPCHRRQQASAQGSPWLGAGGKVQALSGPWWSPPPPRLPYGGDGNQKCARPLQPGWGWGGLGEKLSLPLLSSEHAARPQSPCSPGQAWESQGRTGEPGGLGLSLNLTRWKQAASSATKAGCRFGASPWSPIPRGAQEPHPTTCSALSSPAVGSEQAGPPLPLPCPIQATATCPLFSGPAHHPLCRSILPQIATWLAPSWKPGLCSNVTSWLQASVSPPVNGGWPQPQGSEIRQPLRTRGLWLNSWLRSGPCLHTLHPRASPMLGPDWPEPWAT